MAQRGIPLSEFFRETLRALNEQGLTDRAIHEAGGPAEATLTNWRTKPGLSARRDSLDKLDTALRWPKGTALDYAIGHTVMVNGQKVLVTSGGPDQLDEMRALGYIDYGPFWSRPESEEQDAYFRRVAADLEGAVSAIRKSDSAAEGAVGEGLLTVEERDKVIAVLAATGAALVAAAQELTALAEELRQT